MRTDDEILSLSFCIITVSAIFVGMCVFLFLGCTFDDATFQSMGFLAVLGASLIFSTTTIPYKMPQLDKKAIDPLIFTVCQACGISLVSLPILLFLCYSGSLNITHFGALGSCFFTVVAYTSMHAVNRVGISVGPGTWSGVGMITSFCIGLLVFEETVRVVDDAAIALALLVCGVFCISTSKRASPDARADGTNSIEGTKASKSKDGSAEDGHYDMRHNYDGLPMEVQSTAAPDSGAREERRTLSSILEGLAFCVLTGLFDGCLMVPYKLYASSVTTDTAHHEIYSGLNYLVSFAFGAIVCMPALCIPMILYNRGCDLQGRGDSPSLREAFFIALPAGSASGALWALANILSVLGTATISMSVSFPLTQTCMLWAVCIGTLYFQEPVGNKVQLGLGVVITLTGAYFLAASK